LKKIDLLILRSFAGPFFMTFGVVVLFFVLQFFYVYIDDFIGKGLHWFIIVKLVVYLSANTIPLAMPLAILLSSIMTYGTLGEKYELIAMKASGISLLKFIRGSFIAVVFLALFSLWFSDQILPTANLKFYTTLLNITRAKPSLDIEENTYYHEMTNYVIKIDRKDMDGRHIYGVYVANQSSRKANDDIIVAEKGEMYTATKNNFLVLKLYNGYKYERIYSENRSDNDTKNYSITRFKEMEKVFDLSEFEMAEAGEDMYKNHYIMMNISQLKYFIDSLNKSILALNDDITNAIGPYYWFIRDSTRVIPDSLHTGLDTMGTLTKIFGRKNMEMVYNRAISFTKTMRDRIESPILLRKSSYDQFRVKARVELQRKFMLAFSLIVMFLVGAPFGALVRKGGFGYPLVFAVLFFVIFFILYSIGEKMAKNEVVSPFFGIWMATFVLLPLAIWFTYKAINDSPLLIFENYGMRFKKIKDWIIAKTK
jgi:lipopolysaccharide export system permease protein